MLLGNASPGFIENTCLIFSHLKQCWGFRSCCDRNIFFLFQVRELIIDVTFFCIIRVSLYLLKLTPPVIGTIRL